MTQHADNLFLDLQNNTRSESPTKQKAALVYEEHTEAHDTLWQNV